MKRLLLFFFITLFPKVLFAQLVTVQDSSTKTVLPGVSVYNKSHSTFTQTDLNGTFDSGLFDDKELIIFRLMGYELFSISKQNIQSDTLYLTPKIEGLNEIVVSASKFRQDIRRLPVRVRRIDADDISMMQPQTTADLLSRTGSVYVQKSQLGGGSPMIRGFATNRVLITVDGIRMNNAIFRGGNIQNVISIDPYAIESSELIFGPGTVISGSDAIGGVMNFNTRRLPFAKSDSLIHNTDLAFRSSTATKERTYHVGHMQSSGNWTGYVSFSKMNLGDLTMGRYGPETKKFKTKSTKR
jgi:hemoglobin/transferrin/lactoferrin receptor protein